MNQTEVYNLARKWADEYSDKYNVDPDMFAKMLVGIAKKESNFNEKAQNKKSTARGLMQMLICTQREVEAKRLKIPFAVAMFPCKNYTTAPVGSKSDDEIFNPDYAMQLAAAELGYQYKRYKAKYPQTTWQVAVHAYNQGSYPGARKNDGLAYAKDVLSSTNEDFAEVNLGANRREFY